MATDAFLNLYPYCYAGQRDFGDMGCVPPHFPPTSFQPGSSPHPLCEAVNTVYTPVRFYSEPHHSLLEIEVCRCVCVCVCVGSCLATKDVIGNLPAMGRMWVIMK